MSAFTTEIKRIAKSPSDANGACLTGFFFCPGYSVFSLNICAASVMPAMMPISM